MKKVLPIFVLASLLVIPFIGLAATVGTATKCSDITVKDECGKGNSCFWDDVNTKCTGVFITEAKDVIGIITTVGNWIFVFLLAISALFLVYAGFLWVTAGGNPENVNKAKTMLINAMIGVAVGLGARGIVAVIKSILGSV